jgi:hypothetical protein
MNTYVLVFGDTLAIFVVTLIGFATHGEGNASFVPRMAAAFFPLVLSWFLFAPFLGLFLTETTSDAKQLWRPVLAMIFAGPFATVLRGLLLNVPIIPIFVLVLSTTSAFGILVWRGLYFLFSRTKKQ